MEDGEESWACGGASKSPTMCSLLRGGDLKKNKEGRKSLRKKDKNRKKSYSAKGKAPPKELREIDQRGDNSFLEPLDYLRVQLPEPYQFDSLEGPGPSVKSQNGTEMSDP